MTTHDIPTTDYCANPDCINRAPEADFCATCEAEDSMTTTINDLTLHHIPTDALPRYRDALAPTAILPDEWRDEDHHLRVGPQEVCVVPGLDRPEIYTGFQGTNDRSHLPDAHPHEGGGSDFGFWAIEDEES